jgi:hypothetical protein
MILQSIAGVKHGQLPHQAIPRDLGDDRCGGNGRTAGIAIDHSHLYATEAGFLISIDETQMGLNRKSRHGAAHGEETRL